LAGRVTASAIAGLGMSELGRVYDKTATSLAADAVRAALADAGLTPDDMDGLLVSHGLANDVSIHLAPVLGLRDLAVLAQVNAYGATAGVMIAMAAQAIDSGAASVIACVFADVPLRPHARSGAAYGGARRQLRGYSGLQTAAGVANPNIWYALAARRHMERYGTTSEQLGAIAVAQRTWAAGNPLATMRTPLTLADHQTSRWVAEPLHLLDCCLVTNGAIAVVVTSARSAAHMNRPAVHIWGYGQAHTLRQMHASSSWGLVTGAVGAGRQAMAMAGITPGDVTVCQLYDCYTYTVLVTLEDYGFCAKGEGGPFVADGRLAPGGALPCNTGGGQLSGYYMWGMTPLAEAVIQARHDGGLRQVPNPEIVLVSGNGGILEHHSTLVLSPHPRTA
jgi:acetyl-CoA acetyltransferase